MGLDIIQGFDMQDFDQEFEVSDLDGCELSRAFCDFMCRKDVVDGEADLDQIGRMFKVDISVFYLMEKYIPEWEIEEMVYSETNPEQIRKRIQLKNAELRGNIDAVISTLNVLIPKLEEAKDISEKIDDNGFPTIHQDYYRDLNTSKEGSYIENNLIQDLRSILRASKSAKSMGGQTTFFAYG